MGLFGNRRKWESFSVEDIGAEIISLQDQGKHKEAKAYFDSFKADAKNGKIPGVTPKEQKEMEKIYRRASEGEKGIKAARTSLKELAKASGNQGYKNRPLRERVHPAKYRQDVASGKYRPNAAEAADIKKSDPVLYQQLLEQERRRRGL